MSWWGNLRNLPDAGRATPLEITRDWCKRNAVELPRVTVADAVEKLKVQAKTDGKSDFRRKQLAGVLDRFAEHLNQEVHTLTPKMIAEYLTALELAERTRRNHRDVIGYFTVHRGAGLAREANGRSDRLAPWCLSPSGE